MLSPQTKIAIISLQAYNLFRTDSAVVVGGAEVQLKQLATLLQKHYGCQIRFICLANESGIKKFDGLELACIPRSLGQLAKVNAIQQALRDYAPDFVFQRGWGLETFLAAQHAKKHGAKFVYMAACVWDVERPTLRGWLNWRRALYWLGLKKADAVVAQSQFQQEAFLNNFHIQSRIIRSFQPQPEPVSADKNTLLWVGRANPVKRPKLFIDLAERLPDIPCVMILNASRDQAYFDALQERAHCLPNLRFIPYVPHDQIMPYFHRACPLRQHQHHGRRLPQHLSASLPHLDPGHGAGSRS